MLAASAGLAFLIRDIQAKQSILAASFRLRAGTDSDQAIAASIAHIVIVPLAVTYDDFDAGALERRGR